MCQCSDHRPDLTKPGVWRRDDANAQPQPVRGHNPHLVFRADVLETIEEKIKQLDNELRALSLDIHGK